MRLMFSVLKTGSVGVSFSSSSLVVWLEPVLSIDEILLVVFLLQAAKESKIIALICRGIIALAFLLLSYIPHDQD